MIKLSQHPNSLNNYFEILSNIILSDNSILGGVFSNNIKNTEEKLKEIVGKEVLLTSSGTSALLLSIDYAMSLAGNRKIVFCISEYIYFSLVSRLLYEQNNHKIQILKASDNEVDVEPAEYLEGYYHIFILTSHNNKNVNINNAITNVPKSERFVIEDRCLLFGTPSEFENDIGCYSFSNNKMISCGEGGFLSLKDIGLKEYFKWKTYSGIIPNIKNHNFMYMGDYTVLPCYNPNKSSISVLCTSMILSQLNILNLNINRRIENYILLDKNLQFTDRLFEIPKSPLFYPLVLPKKINKNKLKYIQLKLLKNNIQSHLGVLPFTYYLNSNMKKKIISIPCHSCLNNNDLNHIIKSIKETINEIL